MTLPAWAVVTPERRAHVERVAALLATWATAMHAPEGERARWLKAAWLHDALRDAPAANELAHGPLARRGLDVLRAPGVAPEYLALVDDQMRPVARVDARTAVLVAAKVGKTRLIDNVVLGEGVAADPAVRA